jgi:hypothetical protein
MKQGCALTGVVHQLPDFRYLIHCLIHVRCQRTAATSTTVVDKLPHGLSNCRMPNVRDDVFHNHINEAVMKSLVHSVMCGLFLRSSTTHLRYK